MDYQGKTTNVIYFDAQLGFFYDRNLSKVKINFNSVAVQSRA